MDITGSGKPRDFAIFMPIIVWLMLWVFDRPMSWRRAPISTSWMLIFSPFFSQAFAICTAIIVTALQCSMTCWGHPVFVRRFSAFCLDGSCLFTQLLP